MGLAYLFTIHKDELKKIKDRLKIVSDPWIADVYIVVKRSKAEVYAVYDDPLILRGLLKAFFNADIDEGTAIKAPAVYIT